MIFKRLLKPVFSFDKNTAATKDDTTTRNNAIDILARTLWGEARGESLQGKEAVANVIINRHTHAKKRGTFWWGNSITDICQKPFQFSCWNDKDPNRAKLLAVTSSDTQFGICLRIANRAVNGLLPDHTHGADHYHADTITPKWARNDAVTTTIGRHIFYHLEK